VPARDRPHPPRRPGRVPHGSPVVHRLLPPRGDGMSAVERLDDVAMNEVHLETPVSDDAIAALELGDVVYLSGVLYTAREGVYRQVVDKGVPFPQSVRALTNVNFHCSPAAATRPDGTHVVQAVPATPSFRFGTPMGPWLHA